MKIYMFNLFLFIGMSWNSSAVSLSESQIIDTIPQTYIGQINFDNDRYILKEIYDQRLESISILLKNNPDFQLKIIGFSPHNPMTSQRLSYSRAVAIRNFLIEKYEIKAERLVIEFYENEPDLCSCAKLYLVK
jgi:outer membrane protein OmpA-like peptidoglycan-associated protein